MGDVDVLPLQPPMASPSAVAATKDKKKRGSSFSLSYFDEDDEVDDEVSPPPPVSEPSSAPSKLPQTAEEPKRASTPQPAPTSPPNNTDQQVNEEVPEAPASHAEETEDPATTEEDKDKQDKEGQVPTTTSTTSTTASTTTVESSEQQQQETIINNPTEDIKCFFTHDSFPVLKENALEGKLHNTNMRGITWRVLLGVLSPDTSLWAAQMQKHREDFMKIKEEHIIDPHKASMHSEADKFNPLSQDEENPWKQYFQNAELQKEITHDVQGNGFFDKQETKDVMTQLLFLYAKEHSATRYIQGMNELLAPILWVLTTEKSKTTDSPSIFDIVSDEQYVIHDTYTLFSHLLEIVGRWFSPLKSSSSPVQQSKRDSLLDDKLYFGSGHADESTNLQIVQQCRHIHYNLLTEVEPHLSRYLKDLQIEPHLYMLRWVRILLTQVFSLQDVLIIWDGIFAFGNNAVLLDWLCVAMLVNVRHLLLGQDYSRCMQLLFNYPQDQDINALIASALKLYYKYQQQRQISPPKNGSPFVAPKPTTNTVTVKPAQPPPSPAPKPSPPIVVKQQNVAKPSPPPARAATPPTAPQYPASFQEPAPTATPITSAPKQKSILQLIFSDGKEQQPASELPLVNEEAQTLRNTAAHMANRLERVLFLLGNLPSTPENEETLKLAVEEVTQVKQALTEASESKVRFLANTHNNNEDSHEANNINITTTNNNNNTTNPLSNSTQQETTTPFETNTPPTRATSPPTTQNVYEKILKGDLSNIFRRK